MKKGFALALALVSCFTLALAGCGGGQKSGGAAKKVDYPTKNITMICPWGAGGGTDSILRALCKSAEKDFGKTITVSNVTGGGGDECVDEGRHGERVPTTDRGEEGPAEEELLADPRHDGDEPDNRQ